MKLSRLAAALVLALSLSPVLATESAAPAADAAAQPEFIPQSGVSLEDIQTFVAV